MNPAIRIFIADVFYPNRRIIREEQLEYCFHVSRGTIEVPTRSWQELDAGPATGIKDPF